MKASNLGLWFVGALILFMAYIVMDMSSPVSSSGGKGSTGSIAEVHTSTKPVLVEFYADWCGPCRVVGPVVEALADEVADKARVIRINVDQDRAAASTYGIRSIPTFIAFQNGEETGRQSGAISKTAMKQMIGL